MTGTKALSPLRYAGGKSWLAATVCSWLKELQCAPKYFVEPYAGGANVGLSVARAGLATHVVLGDRDPDLAAFWSVVFYGDVRALTRRVRSFDFSESKVRSILSGQPVTPVDTAFKLLLRNRVSRSGLLTPSSGLLKRGENDKGLGSRWYPATLCKRLKEIEKLRGQLHFVGTDASLLIEGFMKYDSAVFFIDPPYCSNSGPGSRLYNFTCVDDRKILSAVARGKAKSIVTYHDDPGVRLICEELGLSVISASQVVGRLPVKDEIVIAGPRDWCPW